MAFECASNPSISDFSMTDTSRRSNQPSVIMLDDIVLCEDSSTNDSISNSNNEVAPDPASLKGFLSFIFRRFELGSRFVHAPIWSVIVATIIVTVHFIILTNHHLSWDDKIPSDTPGLNNLKDVVIHGKVYLLLSSSFIHWGFDHLVSNFMSLLFCVPMEMENGFGVFVITYMYSSFCGKLFSAAIGNRMIITTGSSTGICGLLAIFITSAIINRENVPIWFVRIIICIMVFGLVVADLFTGEESNWTLYNHLGGFVSAIPISLILIPNHKVERWEIPIVVIALISVIALIVFLPIYIWAIRDYDFLRD